MNTNTTTSFSTMNLQEPIDTIFEVVAPENVSFQYRLAGPFIRAAAFCLDVTIVLSWFILSTLCVVFSLLRFLATEYAETLVLFFVIFNTAYCFWFWLAVFEAFCSGQTLGKKAFGLRTISSSGQTIGVVQALLRNVLRFVDVILGPAVALIMASTGRQARLGDLAADTIVVNERLQKRAVSNIVFYESNVVTVENAISSGFLISEQLHQALSLYVSRRLEISAPRRYEIAAPLAAKLARLMKFPYQVDPDVFLCALWQRATGGTGVGRGV